MKALAKKLLKRIADGLGITALASDAAETRRLCNELQYYVIKAPDGFPLPTHRLHTLVSGNDNLRVSDFLTIGASCASGIRGVLERHGLSVHGSVLDFGCGCGRVIRHFSGNGAKLFGTDYNPELVEWCRANLPFAQFAVNQLEPPLDYPDASFDLIYAFSVFTHLPAALQRPWMAEMRRILKPGGHIFFTAHGIQYAKCLSGRDAAKFSSGSLVVVHEEAGGENKCNAYHPVSYVSNTLAGGFDLVEHIEGSVVDAQRRIIAQDCYLLRR